MAEPVRVVPPRDPGASAAGNGPLRVLVRVDAMSDEQVALLAEDLVEVLVRRAARQCPQVPSEPP